MRILEHLFLVGEFPTRAHLLSELTLEQFTLCPDGASHSIYEELWHVVAYQQSIIEPGDPVGQSRKLYQYAKDNLIDTRRYSISREPDRTLIPRVEYAGFHLMTGLKNRSRRFDDERTLKAPTSRATAGR